MGQALSLCSQNDPLPFTDHLLNLCRAPCSARTRNSPRPEGPGWTPGGSPTQRAPDTAVPAAYRCSAGSRKDASGTLLGDHESSHAVTGSRWGRGRGPRPGPRGAESPPPSQGRLLPGVPSVHAGDRRRIFRSQLQVPLAVTPAPQLRGRAERQKPTA